MGNYISTLLGILIGNFGYQWITMENWGSATARSFFMFVGVFIFWVVSTLNKWIDSKLKDNKD